MPTRLSSSSANKTFKSKNSVGRKRCQLTLKVLKVLLLHLFVTLLIKKATGSDNRHFFFKVLENEIKEEFLTYSTSCTPEQIQKKYIAEAIYPRMHYPKRNDILWELLPFHNWSFSTERMDYQLEPLSAVSNGAWDIFQKRDIHFIHLNINRILPKIDERRHIAKLTNATIIGLNETKLDNAF